MLKKTILLLACLVALSASQAAELSATINDTKNQKALGTVHFSESAYGLLITPKLSELPPGLHGLHLHQHPNCGDHGNDAGGHFDPQQTNSHQGPYGKGHLGDLPVLYVSADGKATTPILAPRLKLSDLKGLTVMVHANGDNYSDNPPLGGGGAREACGVIQ
ncbi:superoxide dismutase family protein [Legionella sp. km772]|uniref:superoxide dismutase family protein n=1 Tax=Legionella sp. km772 TaxID=2498111 RepID=UPI000F8DD5B4|nr:superoxide dismutase family protein [Legionella sp. km772]RUR05942.1 superoxide dismutase [Legionella sp. km772]